MNLEQLKYNILSFCVFLGLTFSTIGEGFAQNIVIEDGTITTCSGTFVDDGNEGGEGGPYINGNDYTFTICPDSPGDVITIEFVAFSLYTSPNPNNSDYLYIYDGDDDTAASLGSYTGDALQGLPVTGTVNNTSGCLTFVFQSNPNGSQFPGWEGIIDCTTPCATPTAASEIIDPEPQGPEQSIGVCLDAPITFADNGSFAEDGFNLEYWVWNFGDGTIDTLESAEDVTHSFNEPGEYIVNLSVVDNNGCRSLNVEPLQVLVSTIPIFNTNFETPVCIDGPVTIDGSPIQSITWTALPPQVVAGETYLADGAGFEYSSTLTFDFFEAGATLDDCSDLEEVFVNMEHSYLGDLQMSITCPDGTNVILLEYPNGGGGTYLGEALDDGTNDPGIGYEYGWAPDATNGNLPDQDTEPVGGPTPGNTVPPGTYQSDYDMCDLVGCPLNGEWTFNVLDNLAIDNGFIFEWGIAFNPELFPDITTFTPIVGLGPDSTYWEGPNIINTSADGNVIETSYSEPGFYDYTMFATNNFGCTFDTTITIEAIEGPDITAGQDLTYCEDPVQLEAAVVGDDPPSCSDDAGTYSYCYENNDNIIVTFCPDNPGDGATFMSLEFLAGQFDFFDNVVVYDGDDETAPILVDPASFDPLAGLTATATAGNPTGCITLQISSDGSNSCADGFYEEIEIEVTCGGPGGLIWEWTPADGLSNPNIQNPFVEVEQATEYTVTAYPEGFPGCLITDQVIVSPDALADPGLNTDTTFCYNSPLAFLTDYLNGNPASGGTWTDPDGNEVENEFNPTQYPEGASFTYTYTVTNGTCENQSTLNIDILPSTNNSCCQTNAQAGSDDVACALTYQMQAQPTVGNGEWTAPPEVTFSDVNDPNAIATCESPGGSMTLTWTDNNGSFCNESDEVTIQFSDSLELFVVEEDAICFNECTGQAIAISNGGTAPGGSYTYDWFENGVPGVNPSVRDSLCQGTYSVKVFDNFGCTDSTTFQIGQPQQQSLFITQAPPLCADSCNGQIGVKSDGAVSYSFDGGDTFVPDSIGFVCAGEHIVIARNEAGCEIQQIVSLVDPPRFEASFNINPLPTTTKNTRITFQNTSSPGPIAQTLYTYGDDPVIGEGDTRISTFTFPKDTSGTYPVTMTTTNVNGCMDTLTQNVIINDDLLWYVPNSFTPNGDGFNEVWKPIGNTVDVRDYELAIFSRWGEQVFFTKDIDRGWNGDHSDDSYFVNTAVYTYIITFSSATTEEKYEITGHITVLR
ncbi:MAG: gliding motility-associated C-terminal domain-containing protein [Flavobacteriales bacterium]|nr:gliding motility-associated C-terminal domain-containing protein [Flavobacteriales bacterium]